MSFKIAGTGSALPEYICTNEEMSTLVDTSDEWIATRTGIRERRILKGESLLSIASKAAQRALQNADVKPEELDLIIGATVQSDNMTPSLACELQAELSAHCPAFDISAACSGFVYALDVAAGYFSRGAKKVLIVAAEALSRLTNWADRSTCVLFGDGAGAVVLTEGEDLLAIKISAKGLAKPLNIPASFEANPFDPASSRSTLSMDGREIYKFATAAICEDLKEISGAAGVPLEHISWYLTHQANKRIIAAAAQRLGQPIKKFLMNIERVGNTSAASIPILLDDMAGKGTFKNGDILAMCAFGGGLTTGACVLRWSKEQR